MLVAMHHPHFFVDSFDPSTGSCTLTGENLHHLKNVLRMTAGSIVVVFDSERRFARCQIAALEKSSCVLAIVETGEAPPPSLVLHLGLGLLQPHKIDLVVQKAAEWGVSALTLLTTKRSRSAASDKTGRWSRIAIEAACQSEAMQLLEVREIEPLATFLRNANGRRLILDEEGGTPLKTILAGENPGQASILSGAEGGWARDEVAAAEESGFERVSLGRRNFRAETAAIAGVTLMMHHWGMDWA